MNARRIAIWGNSGSGKSTLAERLSMVLGLPVYHVDKIMWQSGWKCASEAEFSAKQRIWLNQPTWIIDGVGPISGMRERFARAELIVFLDTPVELCRLRAQRRIDEDRTEQNRFMADGCRYSEVIEKQWEVIDHFERYGRQEIEVMIKAQFGCAKLLRLDGAKSVNELIQAAKCG